MIEHAEDRRGDVHARAGTSVVLRPADPADHDPIIAGLDLSAATIRLLAKDLAGTLPRHCLVAEDGDEIVGLAMTTRQPDEVHLLDISVAASRRRRGVARHLLGRLAALAMADGATAMTLEVRTSNQAARSLYAGLGFVDHGVRPGYYRDGEDAAILWHDDLARLVEATASVDAPGSPLTPLVTPPAAPPATSPAAPHATSPTPRPMTATDHFTSATATTARIS